MKNNENIECINCGNYLEKESETPTCGYCLILLINTYEDFYCKYWCPKNK